VEFASIEKILYRCVSWREQITEKTESMSWVSKLAEELNTRKELWKYYQVTFHHIKDWKNTPIKKLNVKKVYEKINYWESEAQRLKGLLKDEDPVWMSWRSLLQSFKLSMKWIEKLASDTFGVSFN